MLEAVLTVLNLGIAAICLTLSTVKAAAARNDPDRTLKITASVLAHAGLVYLLSAPAVYRSVGSATGSPSLPSLLVDVAILLCVGHAHLLTLLWHPRRRTPDALRRSVTAWAPMYTVAIVAMATLFRVAGLTGPTHAARPLSFATSYAYVPAALACELVYLTALVAGIVATVRQCRGPDGVIALPERPELARSLRLFAAAVALDLAYVACTATAALAAARGEHRLDFLAALGSLASGTSALVASYGLAKPALAARAAERRDHEILLRLWATVIGAPGSPAPRPARWWNSRYALTDLIVDILDGIRALHPWMSPAPARAVDDLTPDTRAAKPGPAREADAPYQPDTAVDLLAVKAAATLRHAHASCAAAQPVATPSGGAAWPFASAASGIPATGERAHLVQVARHLNHPLVAAALHRTTTGATLTGSARRTGAQQHPVGRDYDGLREGK